MQAYHSPGTCTFYGTANTNQMLVEIMGLHLPGASFVNPGTPLREALTAEAARQVTRLTRQAGQFVPLGHIVDERVLINAVVALHATGGSTNHTLHLPAIARAAGVQLDWQDMAELSEVVPTLAHVYPNGKADINHFQAAGGIAFLVRELLDAGLLHEDVETVAGRGLRRYAGALPGGRPPDLARRPRREPGREHPAARRAAVLPGGRPAGDDGQPWPRGDEGLRRRPRTPCGGGPGAGLPRPAGPGRCLQGRRAGPRPGGGHALPGAALQRHARAAQDDPFLGVLQDRGFKVALVTDGRMSGASGKIPAAIHVTPEAYDGGPWPVCATATSFASTAWPAPWN